MPIQFSCPSCRQPIEVDDEFGGAQVSCPYCRNVVTAPTESTLSIAETPGGAETPEARPTHVGAESEEPPSPPAPPQDRPHIDVTVGAPPPWAPQVPMGGAPSGTQRNVPGIVSIVAGVLALGLYFMAASVAFAHLEEIGIDPGKPMNQAEIQKKFAEVASEPGKHPWIGSMVAAFVGACLSWIGAVICGIMGMSQRYRSRRLAITGLVICLILPLLNCAGMALG